MFTTSNSQSTCLFNICQNDGSCSINSLSQNVCSCKSGFSGVFCQIALTSTSTTLTTTTTITTSTTTTTTLTTTTTTKKTTEIIDRSVFPNCVDNSIICQLYASRGYCQSFYFFNGISIPIYCALSCNNIDLCPPAVTTSTCNSNPCQNDGLCSTNSQNKWSCTCLAGFTGISCQTAVTPCGSNPCQNGGSCSANSLNQYNCLCPPSTTGANCQIITPCRPNPCRNEGRCFPTGFNNANQFTCTCPAGFAGTNCQTLTNPCLQTPCLNGAVCLATSSNQYVCSCQSGFTGNNCQNVITVLTACDSNPCQNGGQCSTTSLNKFTCQCPVGFMGSNCQVVGACVDRNPNCQFYASRGFCSSVFSINGIPIPTFCPVSCKSSCYSSPLILWIK